MHGDAFQLANERITTLLPEVRTLLNISRQRQNGRHFAIEILRSEDFWRLLYVSYKFTEISSQKSNQLKNEHWF